MEDLISVVIPVYNVEKYLERCLNSVMNQTYKNLEIILVDDGSKDSSGQMCDEFAKKDSRIKVVHKKNGGLSSARNAGLRIAAGKYVGFVDSDDDIELEMYSKMINVMVQYNVDFVMSDYLRILSNGNSYKKILNIDGGYYDKCKIVKEIFPQLIMRNDIEYGPLLSVWHCLYNTNFLRDNNIYFDEQVKWSEDNIFSSFVGYKATKFYYMKKQCLYHYYENAGSITTSYRKGAWKVYMTMNEHLHDYFEDKIDYDFSMQLKYHTIYYACSCLNQACNLDKQYALKEIDAILNSNELSNAFYKLKNVSGSYKLKIQLLMMKYHMSRIIYYKNRCK